MSLPREAMVTLLAAAAALMAAGCPCPGRIIPREQLVAAHNANAAKVKSLWAVADVSVRFREGTVRLTDGRLLMLKRSDDPFGPQHFMLRVKEMGSEFFRLGGDGAAGEHYYWFDPPEKYGRPAARWGRIEDLHRPGWETPPIDPTRLLAVLDVMDWPVDPERMRVAAFTPMTNPCVYELFFVSPGERGLELRKVWSDRRDEHLRGGRGGSWEDRPKSGRSSHRWRCPAWQRVSDVGFRIVIEDKESPERKRSERV